MVDFASLFEDAKKNIRDTQEISIVCSQSFFDKLINHWRMRVVYRARQEFSEEMVVVSMAPRDRWKLTGKISGKAVKIKRGVRVTAEMEPVFTVET